MLLLKAVGPWTLLLLLLLRWSRLAYTIGIMTDIYTSGFASSCLTHLLLRNRRLLTINCEINGTMNNKKKPSTLTIWGCCCCWMFMFCIGATKFPCCGDKGLTWGGEAMGLIVCCWGDIIGLCCCCASWGDIIGGLIGEFMLGLIMGGRAPGGPIGRIGCPCIMGRMGATGVFLEPSRMSRFTAAYLHRQQHLQDEHQVHQVVETPSVVAYHGGLLVEHPFAVFAVPYWSVSFLFLPRKKKKKKKEEKAAKGNDTCKLVMHFVLQANYWVLKKYLGAIIFCWNELSVTETMLDQFETNWNYSFDFLLRSYFYTWSEKERGWNTKKTVETIQ